MLAFLSDKRLLSKKCVIAIQSPQKKCPNKSYSLLNYGFDFIWMQRTSLKYTDETKALGYVKWVEIGMSDII